MGGFLGKKIFTLNLKGHLTLLAFFCVILCSLVNNHNRLCRGCVFPVLGNSWSLVRKLNAAWGTDSGFGCVKTPV